ncbi:MAG: CBS domain-containing protein [Tenericutes bacterium]|nr:CBS domain-containing protein [Mycoplasmatota bacterium]
MTNEEQFLDFFKKLEKYLRIEYNQGNYSYSGFMSTIYRIKKSNTNPLISNKFNFDILQQASQVRNIISHNNDVIIPSEKFLDSFKEVVERIIKPLKVENVMIPLSKLKTAGLNTLVGDVINMLKQYGFNTIPIINDNQLMGVFTEKSVFDYLSMNKNQTISKKMKINDLLEAIDLNSDPRKYFEFISRDASLDEAYECFTKDLKSRRELLLLLVTEEGEKEQKLLGIVALRDIEKALFN